MGAVDESEVRGLIAEAQGLHHGASRMAVAEEAVRIADVHGDLQLGYETRMAALEAAVFGGFPEKALVAFGWLTGTCDREPERFPESRSLRGVLLLEVDLLWAYKWVVQNTPGFPQISRAQIEGALDEMERRYERNGFSLRPVWMNRAWVGMELGESPEQITRYYNAWELAERDAYADCEACEQNFRVEVHRFVGDWDRELEAAQPLLDNEMSCAEVPHLTVSNLVMPMWLHGEHERAARLHVRGYEMCHDNRDFLAELAEHVDYRIVSGDLPGALQMAEHHLAWVDEARSGRRRWRWFLTLGELFARVAADRDRVVVRIPRNIAPPGSESPHDPARLAAWFREQTDELTRAFDARNGNDAVSRWTQELRERLRG